METKMKLLLLFTGLLLSFGLMAQSYNDNYYDGIGNYGGVSITSKQREQIIQIKKNIGRRHAAIGKSGLRGQAKGQAHRDLNMEIRKEIRAVLNSDQNTDWDKYRNGSSSTSSNSSANAGYYYRGGNSEIDAIEDKIDALENEYDRRIDAVEDDYSLPKSERKYRKQMLKDEMKSKKRELKREKQLLKDQWN